DSGGHGRTRALEYPHLQLHRQRLSGGEVVVEIDSREPPPHHARRPVSQREGKMRKGDRNLPEHRRPELADAQGGASIRQIHEGEPVTEQRLLIPERRYPVIASEEIGLERGLRRPLADHRLPREFEADAGVPYVAVEGRLILRDRGRARPLGAPQLPETVEQAAVPDARGIADAADGARRPLG